MNCFKIILIPSLLALSSGTSLYASDILLTTMPPVLAATSEPPVPVYLGAFDDFRNKGGCDSIWTDRDGALGIKAYSDRWGACQAVFTGVDRAHAYTVVLTIQTEFDGMPPYKVLVNDQEIASGIYPTSTSSLRCECDDWRVNCPDKRVNINLGEVTLKKGDIVEFQGRDVYEPCGSHGAYAKWHGISFTPVK